MISLIIISELNRCDNNPCLNNGTCEHLGRNRFKCHCPKNYVGSLCHLKGIALYLSILNSNRWQ